MMTNEEVVKVTLKLLADNKEWESRYNGYANAILKNSDKYGRRSHKFQIHSPLYVYSSITKVKNDSSTCTYDLRFAGQSVGSIAVDKEGQVYLTVTDEQAEYARLHFDFKEAKGLKKVGWKSPAAIDFRQFFEHQSSTKETKIHSQEHRIENWMLAEFSKKTRADGKKLCNIQPVKLGGKFFQLATPISACKHGEKPKYSCEKGGGIDILARVNHTNKKRDNRLAVIELKDENKPNESQAMTLQQSLVYATFLANLLRSDCGNDWWHIFGRSKDVSNILHIDAVTLMPDEGASEEGCHDEIVIKDLNVILHPLTLYYKKDKDGNPMSFSGTLKESLRYKGE